MDIKRFKDCRLSSDYTQKELANKVGVSPSTVAMWERGERDPDTETLKTMCDILGCSSDYLLGRTKYKHGTILEDSKLPPELQGLDIQLEVIKQVAESGLSDKQIKRALKLYELYEKEYKDDPSP